MPSGVYKRTDAHKKAISEAGKNRKGKSKNPYYPKGMEKKYCKKCGDVLGYKNSTGYCIHCYGEYNKEKELWKAMTEHNKKYGIWCEGKELPENVRKKISESVSKNTVFKKMGTNRNSVTEGEKIFAKMHPDFEKEVYIGTGKGGWEKYKAPWFKVDFIDRKNNIAYEIDGSSHDLPGREERDARKDAFLKSKGYEVIRIKEVDLHADIC